MLGTAMPCFIALLFMLLLFIGIASKAIAGTRYRHLVRTGRDPSGADAIAFVLSFIIITAFVVIGGWIFVSSFRFTR